MKSKDYFASGIYIKIHFMKGGYPENSTINYYDDWD
jgi:hypothetical protein